MTSGIETLAPASEADICDIVRGCASDGRTLEIVGGGTKRGIGQPMRADALLSTAGLSGITEYNPGELVVTARAGTPLADIEAALAEHSQMLAFEPGDWRALLGSKGTPTIGAVAAANLSGSRRILAGAARDSLLGVRFVNGRGEAVRNGGRVMKNVTGLDLVKLMAGSWGTLGVLTEVSFKVLPRPETEATLALHGAGGSEAARLMAAAVATSAEISGAAHLPAGPAARAGLPAAPGGSVTLLRVEGFAASVAARLDRLRAALAGGADAVVIGDDASKALWRALGDVAPFAGSALPLWKISVTPTSGHAVAAAILDATGGAVWQDWQGGLLWLQCDDAGDAAAATVRDAIAKNGGGHATLIRAPETVRAAVPVFQPQPPVLAALSERIRAAFDPAGVFNPGRMVFSARRTAA